MASRDKSAFRSLMRQSIQKKEKKIDSPLVRYNELGQAVCKVCNVVIKAESLWTSHLASSQHNKNCELLKARAKVASNQTSQSIQKNQTIQTNQANQINETTKSSQSTLPKKSTPTASTNLDPKEPAKSKNSIPADFFDSSPSPVSLPAEQKTEHYVLPVEEKRTENSKKDEVKNSSEAKGTLPEGFFDNKEADNKARGIKIQKVDISDEMKVFEKVINEDMVVIDTREDEEEGEAAEDREFQETVAQKSYVERVLLLKKRKAELQSAAAAKRKKEAEAEEEAMNKSTKQENEDEDLSEEEDEEEEFHDWRAKQL